MLQFRIVPVPEYQPAMCRNCGGSLDRQWWLDFGYQEEFYGHVYFCNSCVDQMAKVAQYVSPSDVEDLRKQKARFEEEKKATEVYVHIFSRLFGPDCNPNDLLRFLDAPGSDGVTETVPARTEPFIKSYNVSRPLNFPSTPEFKLDFGDPPIGSEDD